jgi:hypothetical protein
MITKPGLYPGMPMRQYLGDPCPAPSASASILHTLHTLSPLHAWTEHPRLNPAFSSGRSTPEQAFGTTAHAMLFGTQEVVAVDVDDWRTKAARETRDVLEAGGKIAMKLRDFNNLSEMLDKLHVSLRAHEIGDVFADPSGQAELTMAWQDDGVWLRGRMDWFLADRNLIVDYKTTESAEPDAWSRKLFQMGNDFQAVLYPQGVAALTRSRPKFIFIVQETSPPYAVSVLDLDPAAREFTNNRLIEAFHEWRKCLSSNKWPAYPTTLCHVGAPVWAVKREETRALAAAAVRELVVDVP